LRRVGRFIWVFPRHAALAFVTGLIAGAIASRFGGVLAPPYAATLGATVVYPALAMVWRVIPRSIRYRRWRQRLDAHCARLWRVMTWPFAGHLVFALGAGFACAVVATNYPAVIPPALSSMDAPCIASGSDELGRNVGLAVIYPALWRGRW